MSLSKKKLLFKNTATYFLIDFSFFISKELPVSGFELPTSGIGSNCSAN